MLEFRILGPLEVLDEGLRRAAGRTESARRAGAAAPACERAGVDGAARRSALGEHPPRTATTSLQNAVSQLRKLLGTGFLLTRPTGYVLELDADQLDLTRFERLVREARAAEPDAKAAAPARGARPLARFAARRPRVGDVRAVRDPPARGSPARRARGADRGRSRARRGCRIRGGDRGPRPGSPAARTPARQPDARALPVRPAGRGARGVPRRAQDAGRGARDRAGAGASGALRLDPPAGAARSSGSRSPRSRTTTTR